ncbi:MAG: amidohydrolase/deacetylase family metallohydrolase [Bryobacterales bacterium]|nr:amidohydrolase/deacetylase family metallohydrolase [Bryobacterales bacterium]
MRKPLLAFLVSVCALTAQPRYDLLLKGGHVIDPKNSISRALDVAIAGGKIAQVAPSIPASEARRVADVKGLYITPGLIDIHVHVYAGTGIRAITGDSSVYPDGFSFRTGVTTMVDAGSAGWRNFPDFRQRVIDRARTRVLALLNISGGGMDVDGEDDPADLDPEAAARMARQHPDVIVGFKTAHYNGPGWLSVERVVKAGSLANMPVMVDFGTVNDIRNLNTLLMDKLRPGDIYTHMYSGHRDELIENQQINPAMIAGRKRGIIFDVGHGGGSFYWFVAVPAYRQKFYPDVISTDLHTGSMNAGMKDMIQVMAKILNMGSPLEDVVRWSTWDAAKVIKRTDLGHLDVGAEADVTVIRMDKGRFGLVDSAGAKKMGDRMLVAEMTLRKGDVVWDLNGRASQDWTVFPYKKRPRASH